MPKRAIRFACTGLFVTGVHALIVIMFMRFLMPHPPLANGVAFIGATLISYVINTTWSFSSRLNGKTFSRFVVVSVFGFLLAMLIAWIAQDLGFDYLIGLCAVALTMPPITFFLHNFLTYQ
ncbi:MAG: GtrA family protein [Pseudomonadota bacterium]